MANVDLTYKTVVGLPDTHLTQMMLQLYRQLFKDADADFFLERLKNHERVLSILTFHQDEVIAFKIGYPKTDTMFYSWIGGVYPEYRHQGIAQQLLNIQEEWAIKQGFEVLQTKSMNRFKPMMILSLKNNFEIVKVYTNDKSQTKIVFEKRLTASSSSTHHDT
ncbi:MAG: GNAT family N-acetyltransferase [Bacteroidota bacterium]